MVLFTAILALYCDKNDVFLMTSMMMVPVMVMVTMMSDCRGR